LRIAVVGPCYLPALSGHLNGGQSVPSTYSFPYISDLVLEYVKLGHNVDVFTSSEDIQSPILLTGPKINVHIGRRRSRARSRALDFFAVERRDVKRALQDSNPDVIHAHWIYEYASASLSVQPDALITAHDDPLSVLRHYRGPYWWFRELLGVITLARARNLTAVAPELKGAISAFTRPKTAVQLVPNGIDLSLYANVTRLSPSAGKSVIATVANGFDGRKNTRVAMKAFALIRESLPDAELRMYGHGHGPDGPAAKWAHEHNLAGGIQFVGDLPHEQLIQELAGEVSLVLHTSRWEACSLAILEARSLGLPIVGGKRSGGVGFTLDGGRSGRLVDARSAQEFAAASLDILRSPSLYARLSENAVNGLRTRFDLQHVARAYEKILIDIVETRNEAKG
jgi:glycosyltransferase involved in cell wall biosynthesis